MNCPNCGNALPDNATYCGYCGQVLQAAQPQYQQPMYTQPQYQQPMYTQPQYQQPAPQVVEKHENMIMGILGAIIGCALGGLSIFLFLKMEFVASISGLITAFCALKGYELLGGKLSKLGIIISMIFMLITPWLAHEIYWATEIMDVFGADFADAFEAVGNLVPSDVYSENLGMIYAFTILGGAAMVFNAFKGSKK